MNKIDSETDFDRLIVVEISKTRLIGLVRDHEYGEDPDFMTLDHVVGLTIKETNQGMAPALASFDYCMYGVMGVEIHGDHWCYWPKNQDNRTAEAFRAAYFTMLELMAKEQEMIARAKGSGIVTASPADMQKLESLARSGKIGQ